VIRLGLREAGVFAAKGLVLLELEQAFEATVAFHEALAISPQDPIAGELLAKALLALEGQSVMGAQDEESVNAGLMDRVREIKQANASGLGRKSRRRRVIHEDPSVLADGMDLDGAAG
jgi:anaphase-promoting complex subunit 6